MRACRLLIGPAWLLCLLVSCTGGPVRIEKGLAAAPGGAPAWEAPREIRVLSWNLGFGALGEEAEFYPDGGRRLIPSSRREVLRYVQGIGEFLEQADADLLLLQEVARPSVVNRRVDLLAEVGRRLPGRWLSYSPDVRIGFPRVSVGLATLAPGPPLAVQRLELPGGTRRQLFHLLISRFPVPGRSGELVLVNVHLSAFDQDAAVRGQQLAAVAAFILAEARQGAWVVLGGDWNLLLADTAFPHATEERYLSWIHRLPEGFPPPGWGLAVDERVPTVRTLQRPYSRGENYTGIIDGFVVSPNVRVLEVRTADLAFRFSDHQPVEVRLRLE